MLRADSWLCAQESLLVELGGPYGMLGIEPWSAVCKANTLPSVLSLGQGASIISFYYYYYYYYYYYFAFWVIPGDAQGLLLALTQELLLVVLRGPYGMLGIEPRLAACKANALPTVLLLQHSFLVFLTSHSKQKPVHNPPATELF